MPCNILPHSILLATSEEIFFSSRLFDLIKRCSRCTQKDLSKTEICLLPPPPPKKKPQGFQAVRLAAMFTAKDANTYKLLCPDIANRDSLKQELWN